MNQKEFVKAMTFLALAYGKEFTQEQIGVWLTFFKNEDLEVFKTAIKRLIEKNKYLPSISEVSSEIAEIKNPMLQLNAEEEFNKVREAVRQFGIYQQRKLLNSLNPYTAEIASQIGLQRICMTEEIQWLKKEFIGEFNAQKSRCVDIMKYNDLLLTDAEKEKKEQLASYGENAIKRLGMER